MSERRIPGRGPGSRGISSSATMAGERQPEGEVTPTPDYAPIADLEAGVPRDDGRRTVTTATKEWTQSQAYLAEEPTRFVPKTPPTPPQKAVPSSHSQTGSQPSDPGGGEDPAEDFPAQPVDGDTVPLSTPLISKFSNGRVGSD